MLYLTAIELLDLNILHLVVSAIVPAIMVAAAAVYLIINHRLVSLAKADFEKITEEIDELSGFGMINMPGVARSFEHVRISGLKKTFNQLTNDSEELFGGKWLPDLNNYFRFDRIFSAAGRNSLSSRPAAAIFSSGLLCAVISLLLQQQLPVGDNSLAQSLIWIPIATGIAASAMLLTQSLTVSKYLQTFVKELNTAIARRVPVFNDQAGIALLIDQMMKHDYKMEDTINEFNQTVSRLAESEMAESISRSVENVLNESVVPPIQTAAATLTDLAQELSQRQEQGMHQLAGQFSNALAADLQRYLGPINQELTRMTSLMSDVKNYIDYAMKALDTTRQQSEVVIRDAHQSLQMIAQSREDLSDDFAVFSEQLRLLNLTSDRLASMQSGHETTLAENLDKLSSQLDIHGKQLESSIRESARTAELADGLTMKQQESARIILENLSSQQNDLAVISDSLRQQIDHFTSSSDQYVRQTLSNFDAGLAELVERMSFTAAEIRDAVDSLPAALRQSPDYSG